jgi:hypothetical protein
VHCHHSVIIVCYDAWMVQESTQSTNMPTQQEPEEHGLLADFVRWKDGVSTQFRSVLPPVIRDHTKEISSVGLMGFTGTMLLSGAKGKQIGQQMYDSQINLLKNAGYQGAALEAKTAELLKSGVMRPAKLHSWRIIYLGTAMASFGLGALLKEKPETKEERANYDKMNVPEYALTRVKESFDPVNHSRQAVSAIGLASGGLAVVSALTQPGGIHKSELMAAGTLLAGFSSLMFVKDSDKAHDLFNAIWWTRLPLILTGTRESLHSFPAYKHPLTMETLKLPNKRMDLAYPVGQWGNFATTVFSFFGSKPRKEAKQEAAAAAAKEAAAQPSQPDTIISAVAADQKLEVSHSVKVA